MYVCNCFAVNREKIENLIQSGLNTVSQIQKQCSAGQDCGSCIDDLCKLLEKCKASQNNE